MKCQVTVTEVPPIIPKKLYDIHLIGLTELQAGVLRGLVSSDGDFQLRAIRSSSVVTELRKAFQEDGDLLWNTFQTFLSTPGRTN